MEKEQTLDTDYGIETGRQLWRGYTFSSQDQSRAELSWFRPKAEESRELATIPFSLDPAWTSKQRVWSTERKRPLYNEFVNEKVLGFMFPISFIYRDYQYPNLLHGSPYVKPEEPKLGASNSVVAWVNQGSQVGNSVFSACDGARRRAWRSMQPRFEGRVALLNSIFELKDFRDIAKGIMNIDYRSLSNNLTSLRKVLKRASDFTNDSTIGDIPRIARGLDVSSRGLAALYLTKQFAVDPTVSDLLNIHKQLGQIVQREQAKFKQKGLAPQSAHYTESIFDDEAYASPIGSGNDYWFQWVRRVRAKFTANMEYMYSYKLRPALAAFRRWWGLDLSAEVVWNALPFSFVADYFAAIADSLHAMSDDPNVELSLTQYCESVLYEREAAWQSVSDARLVWLGINLQFMPGTTKPRVFSGYRYSYYERRVVTPDRGPALPRLKMPSDVQASNLVALVRCWL